MANRRGNSGNSGWLYFLGAPKSLRMVIAAMRLNTLVLWKESYGQLRQHIKKQRHYLVDKGWYSQSYNFSSSHVWIWELEHKESWAPKNWYFQTVVLEKTLASPLHCKEIKPVNPKGNQPWIFIEGTDAKTQAPILWPADMKNQLTGKDGRKDWGHEEKGMTEIRRLDRINSMDMSFSKLRELVMDREAWHAEVNVVIKSRTRLSDWTELNTFVDCHF